MRAAAIPQVHPWRNELRATLRLAWPLILSNLTMASINATDVWLMGKVGPTAIAGVALAVNLYFAFSLIALGLVTAASPMMASALGRKLRSVTDVRRSFRQSVWMVITYVVPFWAVTWHARPIIVALGQEPELAGIAQTFLRGYMWSLLPFLFFQTLRNFVAALERPGWVLVMSVLGVGLNAFFGYGLIFGAFGLPELGVFGGGLAGTITWTILAALLSLVVARDRQFRRFHLFGRFWRPDWPRYREMWRLGLPIGLALGFEGGVFSAAAYLMGLIGEAELAAHSVALQIAALSFMVPWGISQAATVRVGIMYGRQDHAGIGRAGWTGWALAVGFMAVMAVVMLTFPRALITIFLEDTAENAAVIALGVTYLGVAAIFQLVDGAQVAGAGALRGIHDTKVPMIFTFVGYWLIGIGVGVWLAFAQGWDGVGIWSGLAIGLAIVAVLMAGRWSRRERLGLTVARAA
ncbi:MATE family efflux transporter [Sphingomicrobium astaxanthinifaciens]|uniref:MATE family efflux transporter n=1 Tax=Sphingomicrobium astaxanthinifaciens TaxID=1227949 RepID=UPI001FCBB6BF|nr:MATE family efflux transporter [Sphingomicrobium astaxanthinifaciens]MCJ7421680.1 MATE family efflux transporter [Sphingomicrobium astaxanthinifaciens]